MKRIYKKIYGVSNIPGIAAIFSLMVLYLMVMTAILKHSLQ